MSPPKLAINILLILILTSLCRALSTEMVSRERSENGFIFLKVQYSICRYLLRVFCYMYMQTLSIRGLIIVVQIIIIMIEAVIMQYYLS